MPRITSKYFRAIIVAILPLLALARELPVGAREALGHTSPALTGQVLPVQNKLRCAGACSLYKFRTHRMRSAGVCGLHQVKRTAKEQPSHAKSGRCRENGGERQNRKLCHGVHVSASVVRRYP